MYENKTENRAGIENKRVKRVYPISGIPTLSKPNCELLVHAAGSALPLIRGLKLNAEKCISRAENEKYSHCTIVVLP